MPEPSAGGEAEVSGPWWETTPVGAPLLLAFVRLEKAPWGQQPGEVQALQQRARYKAGVEYVASRMGAAQPLHWREDGVLLLFRGDAREPATVRALEAAEALRERALIDLGLEVRLAVHAARVEWRPDTVQEHPALRFCDWLAYVTPSYGVAVTEDVYLTLPEDTRRRLGFLGRVEQEGVNAYVFPANLAARRDAEVFKPGADLRLWEAFRRYVSSPEIRRLRYVGFPLQKKQPPSLDLQEVFVTPEAKVRSRQGSLVPDAARLLAESDTLPRELLAAAGSLKQVDAQLAPEPLSQFIARHRALVVLGDPGSGKTTVLRWLAVVAASGPLAWAEQFGASERLLPLVVSVGRLAQIHAKRGAVGSVVDALALYFQDRNVGTEVELRGFLERVLEAGDGLVLLDGLDEVRSEERSGVLRWLETFCARFPRNRFVTSARIVGYSGFELPGGVEVTLGAFSDEQVRRYVGAFVRACHRWENEGVPDDVGAGQESEGLLQALFDNPRLSDLARNPFLLSSLVLIHRAEGQLPRHRVQAYEIFARTLCETWGTARRVVAGEERTRDIRYEEEAIPILGELALRMHSEWPTGVAPEEFVVQTLAEAMQAREGGALQDAERAAREFLKRAGEDVQIFLERGAKQWGFLHLTFQEFFTAVGLLSSERFEEVAFEHLFDSRWEEVLRLGVGYMALIQKRAQATQRFVRRVLDHQEQGERAFLTGVLHKNVYLAALLASEAGDVLSRPLQEEIARQVVAWNQAMPGEVASPLLRELALTESRGRLLGLLAAELQHENASARVRGLQAWQVLKGGQAPLLNLVRDPSPAVRKALCTVLGEQKTTEAEEALAALARDSEVEVRSGALEKLMGSGRGTARALVASLIGEQGSRDVEGMLLGVLNASVLDKSKRRPSELIGRVELELLVRRGLGQQSRLGQSLATEVQHLEHEGGRETDIRAVMAQVFWRVLVSSPHDNVELQKEVDSRTHNGNEEQSGPLKNLDLLTMMVKSPSSGLQTIAVMTMSLLGPRGAQSALLEVVEQGAPLPQWFAIAGLGTKKSEAAIRILSRALSDTVPSVRHHAALALARMEWPEAVERLVELLRQGQLSNIHRLEALRLLWNLAAKAPADSQHG